jgi:AcrR family transcriptional regulator
LTNWSIGKFTQHVAGASTSGRRGRPPGVDSDETRRRILGAARSCFASQGYAATTNRVIADRAGLTAAAVYHHFGKKPDLMIAVYRVTEAMYQERILQAVEAAGDFAAKLAALVDVIHATIGDDPEQVIFFSVARDEARRHPELKAIEEDRGYTEVFAQLVRSGVDEGVIAARNASRARGAIAALATGLAVGAQDMGVDALRTAAEGCKELLMGQLLTFRPAG